MPAPTVQQRYVSVEAASQYCDVSRTTIYKLISSGEINSSLVGTRRVVDLQSIDDFMERNRDRLEDNSDPAHEPPG